jgi:HEAT repeat protein
VTPHDDLDLTPQERSALRRADQNPEHLTDYDVKMLGELLADGEEHVRMTVAETVAEVSKETDTPCSLIGAADGLIAALDDEIGDVRKRAAGTLGRLRGTSPEVTDGAVEALISALNDKRHLVRSRAAEALGQIGSETPEQAERAVGPLIAAVNDDSKFVRREAATALGRIGSIEPDQVDDGIERLVTAIDDERWGVRREAAKAIGRIGSTAPEQVDGAVGPLVAAINDMERRVRRAAARALGRIGEQSPDRVEGAVGPLIAALDDKNQKVRSGAAWALGRIGERSPKQVAEAVGPLIDALDDEKTRVRWEAATALGHVGPAGTDEEVIEAIDRLCNLLSSNFGTVRRNATVALGRLHAYDRSYSDAVEKALEDRFDGRKTPGEWLSERLNDERIDVAVGAAFALFRAGVTDHDLRMSARSRLREGLDIADHRQFTIQLIVELSMTGPAIHPMMREVFAPDDANEDPVVRDLIPDLIDLLDAPTGEIRSHACRALSHLDADAVEDLERLANEDDDEAVREAANEALERIGVDRGFEEGTDDATGADETINIGDVAGTEAVGTEDVVDAVASPPRRPGVSHGALTVGEKVDAGGQAIISEAQLPTEK